MAEKAFELHVAGKSILARPVNNELEFVNARAALRALTLLLIDKSGNLEIESEGLGCLLSLVSDEFDRLEYGNYASLPENMQS